MIGYNKSEIVGKMRERVILQNRIITQSDSGFQSEIYNDIGIYWSKIEYKTGFEEEDADKITNQQKINITLRYNILVNVNSRFVYRNELYQVEKVEYSDDRRFMTCVCVWRSSYTSIYAGSIFCSASLLAQSSLSAALMRVIKYQASLNAFGSVSADINFVQKAQASLLATGTTTADLTVASAFDADAQAFFNRVTTAGGTLTTTEKNAVNTLVVQMKADGIWTKMKAIYPMVGASAAACAQNLKSSSFTGTFSSGWTFANTGATPNGTTAYMNTGLNPSSHLILDDLSFSYYCRTNNAGIMYECGVRTITTETNLSLVAALRWVDNFTYYSLFHNPLSLSKSQTNSAKYFIFNKPSSTSVDFFENTTKTTSSITNRSLVNGNFYLGAINSNGSAINYSNKQCALLTIGNSLSDTEASNLYTAVQAFQTTLNRQV